MPSVKLETSSVLTGDQEKLLALRLSALCAEKFKKPESVVQVRVRSGLTMSFGGAVAEDSALVEFALIGKIAEEVKTALPGEVAELLAPFGVDAKRLFLRYVETDASAWGWN